MLKANSGSHKDKNVDLNDNAMLPYAWIKLTDLSLFILYVVICIETSSVEVFNLKKNTKDKVLQKVYLKLKWNNITIKLQTDIYKYWHYIYIYI